MEDKRLLRLVKKARHGNNDAFCELMKEKAPSIIYVATCLMGNRPEGEDAAQEALILIGKNFGKLKRPEHFDAWVYRIVYNVCMNEKKKKARIYRNVVDVETAEATVPEQRVELIPELAMEQNANDREFEAALERLPYHYRLCLLMFYYEGMSYVQIAEALELSEQAVPNLMRRAKDKLRDELLKSEVEGMELGIEYGETQLSAAALTDAFKSSKQSVVTPSSLAKAEGAIAVALPKTAAIKAVATSAPVKFAATAVLVATMVGVGMFLWNSTPEEAPVPAPQVLVDVPQGPSVQEPVELATEEKSLSVYVQSQERDVPMALIVKNDESEAWHMFQAELPSMAYETTVDADGYICTVYSKVIDGVKNFYVVVEDNGVMTEAPTTLHISIDPG